MCGVIALVTQDQPTPRDKADIAAILIESGIRGLHACGMALCEPGVNPVIERRHSPGELAKWVDGVKLSRVTIGHTRYSTSGDWRDHRNNQPLCLDGHVLAFNGVIDMAPRQQWAKSPDGKEYETDNDGEILLRKLFAGQDWTGWVSDSAFSFAGVLWDGQRCIVHRNPNRPLWFCKTDRRMLVASTRDILLRAGVDGEITEVESCTPVVLV